MNRLLSDFGLILLFIIGAIIFVGVALFVSSLLRPDKPNEEKLSSYECGEDAVGSAWGQFNSRFYVVGLIFLLFEAEIVFLFPWASVFGKKSFIGATHGLWGWFSFSEMLVFILLLALGLVYVWKKGYLDWVKPMTNNKNISTLPPEYKLFNEKVPIIKK
jgi:NADH-quinone oxidoreductase subunit A